MKNSLIYGSLLGLSLLSSPLKADSVDTEKTFKNTYPTVGEVKVKIAETLWKADLSANKAIANSIERYCKYSISTTLCEIEKINISVSLPGHISIIYKKWNYEYEVHPQFPREDLKKVKFWELNF